MNRAKAEAIAKSPFAVEQKFIDVQYNECRGDGDWRRLKVSSIFPFIRKILFTVQGGCCLSCGKKLELTGTFSEDYATVDHVIPRSKGGSQTSITNMVMLCPKCNSKKSDSIPTRKFLDAHDIVLERIRLMLREKKCPSLYMFPEIHMRLK